MPGPRLDSSHSSGWVLEQLELCQATWCWLLFGNMNCLTFMKEELTAVLLVHAEMTYKYP